jgi:hypothetical protein
MPYKLGANLPPLYGITWGGGCRPGRRPGPQLGPLANESKAPNWVHAAVLCSPGFLVNNHTI